MKQCDQCGVELIIGINCRTNWAKRCVDLNSKKLSLCQRKMNKKTAKLARQRNHKLDRPVKHKSQGTLRECLRCPIDDETGKSKLFLSNGPFHRTCEPCSRQEPVINVKNLYREGDKLDGLDFPWGV